VTRDPPSHAGPGVAGSLMQPSPGSLALAGLHRERSCHQDAERENQRSAPRASQPGWPQALFALFRVVLPVQVRKPGFMPAAPGASPTGGYCL